MRLSQESLNQMVAYQMTLQASWNMSSIIVMPHHRWTICWWLCWTCCYCRNSSRLAYGCTNHKSKILSTYLVWRMVPSFWIIDVKSIYGIASDRIVGLILTRRYDIELRALLSWPAYASYNKDVKMRHAKWYQKYWGLQPIMWDMSNIPAYSFWDADFQPLTYSEYYGENCFKGGISVQLNSWIQAGALWPGRVSDSDYNRREGYLQKQQEFQESNLVEIDGKLEVLPFLNVYDKGYQARTVAWKNGNQGVLQSTFAPSDRRVNRNNTKLSASIAPEC